MAFAAFAKKPITTTTTTNGAPALTAAGAASDTHRGSALTAMSLHLVGPRDVPATAKAIKPRKGDRRPHRAARHPHLAARHPHLAARHGRAGDPLSRHQLATFVQSVVTEGATVGGLEASRENAVELFAMTFDVLDVRDGRGERLLGVWMLLELLAYFPDTTLALVDLIPQFSSWRTLNVLAETMAADAADAKSEGSGAEVDPLIRRRRTDKYLANLARLRSAVIDTYAVQLKKDEAALKAAEAKATAAEETKSEDAADDATDSSKKRRRSSKKKWEYKPSVSLAAKWAPSAKSRFAKTADLATAIRDALFLAPSTSAPSSSSSSSRRAANWASMSYRKLLTSLRAHTDVVEVKMAAKQWSAITPEHVPSIAGRKYRKAFLNKKLEGGADPRSEDPDRVACADKFVAAIEASIKSPAEPGKKRIKGARNQPHEIVKHFLDNSYGFRPEPVDEDRMMEAFWVDMVQSLKEKGTLSSAVSIVDVSGSMSGLPMEVAIALGLLIAELSPEPFKGRMLTFSEKPEWVTVPDGDSVTLRHKVTATLGAHWEMSTDFNAAMDKVLEMCVEHKLPQSALPETMFVFTDMQFDKAQNGGWGYAADDVLRRFRRAGYERAPHLVFWNLRTTGTPTFQATVDTPGVSFMSGFSQAVLKDFMENGVLASGKEITPWEMLQKRLSQERLDVVRRRCEAVGEDVMTGYVFDAEKQRPPQDAEDDDSDSDSEAEGDSTPVPKAAKRVRVSAGDGAGAGAGAGSGSGGEE